MNVQALSSSMKLPSVNRSLTEALAILDIPDVASLSLLSVGNLASDGDIARLGSKQGVLKAREVCAIGPCKAKIDQRNSLLPLSVSLRALPCRQPVSTLPVLPGTLPLACIALLHMRQHRVACKEPARS